MTLLDRMRRAPGGVAGQDPDWPPKQVREHWKEVHSYRLRYSNDRDKLIRANPNLLFSNHKINTYTPVPWPRELARFSAALLFSQPPTVINEAHPDPIRRLMQVNDFGAFAVEGGVKAAAEGTVAIRVIRDSSISNTPLITLVDEDQVIWDVRHRHFVVGGTVVVTRVEPADHGDRHAYYRLLEKHTAGLVQRTLYRGGRDELGRPVPLSTIEEFASLKPEESTGLDHPTLIRWQNIPMGESDYFGLGPLFDDINEAESLLLDRARKAIPRVFVDRSLADESGKLDIDGYILTGGSRLRPTLGKEPGQLVHTVEPKFLSKEHIDWLDHLSQLIVTAAGYAPETWGIQGKTANVSRAVSGYAMKLAQLRTLLTRSTKEHMALQSLGWSVACATAWMLDAHDVAELLPVIELGDGLPDDPLDGAQEVLWLRQAVAASTEQLVRTLHPTWDDRKVVSEVDRIMDEKLIAAGGDVPLDRVDGADDPHDPDDIAGSGEERNAPVA
jgi:hypothetical protein